MKRIAIMILVILLAILSAAQAPEGSFYDLVASATAENFTPITVFGAEYGLDNNVLIVNAQNNDVITHVAPITGSLELWKATGSSFESVKFTAPALNSFHYDIHDGEIDWVPFRENDLVRVVPPEQVRWHRERFVWLAPSDGSAPPENYHWTVPFETVQYFPPPSGYEWVRSGTFRKVPDGYVWYVPNGWSTERWVRMALRYQLAIRNEILEEYGTLENAEEQAEYIRFFLQDLLDSTAVDSVTSDP